MIRTLLKPLVRGFGLTALRHKWQKQAETRARIRQWELHGRPVPPPHVQKQKVLRQYARRYRLRTLVETGTYLGDMVDALKGDFERIISIELSPMLHEKARHRFANEGNIELVQGDSGSAMRTIMKQLTMPTLFWLDGHYSGDITARGQLDTPVLHELEHIFSGASPDRHVILIDDARCFGTEPSYPNLAELSALVHRHCPTASFTVEDDIVRIAPRR
jgi:hypothetical protein